MLVIKFHFANDIRRVTVTEDSLSFKELEELARNLFGNSLPESLSLKYKDDEEDLITVSSGRELEEAFRLSRNGGILRIFISAAEKPKRANSSNAPQDSFFELLEKTITENPFVRNFFNNLEIEVKAFPDQLNTVFGQTGPQSKEEASPTPNKPVHWAFCDVCNQTVRGIRYKCQQCPDYDLCETCEPNKAHVHDASHTFEAIKEPRRACPYAGNRNAAQADVIHPATCDGCSSQIKGLRYKCESCADYDLCEECNKKGTHKETGHTFTTITRPLIPLMKRGCGQGRAGFNFRHPHQDQVVHPAICDGCQSRIKGIRHKCATCPDFDLCEACENKKIHSETGHSFNKILRPSFHRCRRPNVNGTPAPEPSAATPASEAAKPTKIAVTSTNVETPKSVVAPAEKTPEPVATPVPEPVAAPVVEVIKTPEPVIEKAPEPIKTEVVATPAPVAAPVEKSPEVPKKETLSPFEVKLNQLDEMGFGNKQLNIALLVKYNGDMIQTVRHLLDN